MVKAFLSSRSNALAAIGLVLVFPAFILVSFGLMNSSGFPAPNDWLDELARTNTSARWAFDTFLHPIVVLDGLCIALTSNLVPVLHFKTQPQESMLMAMVTFKDRAQNAAMVVLSLFLSGATMTYAFFENFQIVPR